MRVFWCMALLILAGVFLILGLAEQSLWAGLYILAMTVCIAGILIIINPHITADEWLDIDN